MALMENENPTRSVEHKSSEEDYNFENVELTGPSSDSNFKCSLCPTSFQTLKQLQTHFDYLHIPIECGICYKTFIGRKLLRDHCRQVHPEESSSFLCSTCGESFSHFYLLSRHNNTFHGNKPFRCPHCSASYTTNYQQHITSTHTSQTFPCPQCGKEFKVKRYMKTHIRNVHDTKQHVKVGLGRKHCCTQCNLAFNDKATLDIHYTIVHTSLSCIANGSDFSQNCNTQDVKREQVQPPRLQPSSSPNLNENFELSALEESTSDTDKPEAMDVADSPTPAAALFVEVPFHQKETDACNNQECL